MINNYKNFKTYYKIENITKVLLQNNDMFNENEDLFNETYIQFGNILNYDLQIFKKLLGENLTDFINNLNKYTIDYVDANITKTYDYTNFMRDYIKFGYGGFYFNSIQNFVDFALFVESKDKSNAFKCYFNSYLPTNKLKYEITKSRKIKYIDKSILITFIAITKILTLYSEKVNELLKTDGKIVFEGNTTLGLFKGVGNNLCGKFLMFARDLINKYPNIKLYYIIYNKYDSLDMPINNPKEIPQIITFNTLHNRSISAPIIKK